MCELDGDSVNAHLLALNVRTLKEYRHLLQALHGPAINIDVFITTSAVVCEYLLKLYDGCIEYTYRQFDRQMNKYCVFLFVCACESGLS